MYVTFQLLASSEQVFTAPSNTNISIMAKNAHDQ